MTASLREILPSTAALLGVPGATDSLELTSYGAHRVVVVLVDGLGLHLLPQLAPHAPLLASVLNGGTGRLQALESTFPSTTPTSLVTLGTGVTPGEHGVLGFTLNVPGTDRTLTHILWRDSPDPATWQPVPTWFERCTAAGVGATAVLPAEFEGSGLTQAAHRGARFAPVRDGEDAAVRIAQEWERPGTRLVFGYTPDLDRAMHVHGIASPQWQQAAADVDAFLTRLVERMPADTMLLVTADHGGLDIGPDGRVDLADEPILRAGVRVVAGEPRVRYLHTVDGAREDVLAAWRERFGPAAHVQTREEAVAAGRFGPVTDQHLPRVGDVVVTCRADTAVFDSDREPAEVATLVGLHGADSAVETAIPLIAIGPDAGR
ncbi:alkaline phosphatase family protein [uncultured Jatrophihabitans sp.]|uniref:alkaline phosphatase family protein n=1 Tax=uncultured Jatrophihabitans sp. TaxID=1610747 RepID=UPI0035CBBC2E